MGDLEQTQQTVQLRSALVLEPLRSGPLAHEIEAGLEFAWVEGTFDRPRALYAYLGARIDPDVVCGGDTVACVDEEQYFSQRRIWDAGSVSARMQQYDLFLEDRLSAGRLTLRPGIRLAYDDFMQNLNLAPRLAATYDLAGNGRTLLIGGWNRYYGRTLLTYKLREAQSPFRSETRSTAGPIPPAAGVAAGQGERHQRHPLLPPGYPLCRRVDGGDRPGAFRRQAQPQVRPARGVETNSPGAMATGSPTVCAITP